MYRKQIEREKVTLRHMVAIYCRAQRHPESVCGDCARLLRHACERIDACPYKTAAKPACGLCRTNCFSSQLAEQFRKVMQYAGPRMLLRHPILTLAHIVDALRAGSGKR